MGEGADTIGIFPTIAFAEVWPALLLLPLAVVGWLGARSSSMTHQLPMKPDPPVTSTVPFPLMVAPPPMCAAGIKLNQHAVPTAAPNLHQIERLPGLCDANHRPCPPMQAGRKQS